jgi:hypothetical protein
MRLKRILAAGCSAVLLVSSSCKRQAERYEAPAASLAGPQDPDLRVDPAGYRGRHFSGPVYLPRSSPLPDGTTLYSVTYQKGVTVISKDDAARHLVSIGQDDSYVFDATLPQIAKLKPGSVLIIAGMALCTIDSVEKTSNGYVVKASPARITDAIKDGRLEGTYNIDFSRLQAMGTADFDVDFQGYNYHVKFTPQGDRVAVLATIKYRGRLGSMAYAGTGYLSNFVSNVKMQIKNGALTNLAFNNSNLAGETELKWYVVANNQMKSGTIAEITSWPAELSRSNRLSRAVYHVPIVLGALPFDLRISLGFSFIPSFSSKNSVVEGRKRIRYSGSGGFLLSQGNTRPSGSLQVEAEVLPADSRVMASGPVGFTSAAEAPRLELALGWPPASAPVAGFLNFVASYGIVTNGLSNPKPCQTNIMAFSANAGAAYTAPNTFANGGPATGASSSVSLWLKTLKSAGASGVQCPG